MENCFNSFWLSFLGTFGGVLTGAIALGLSNVFLKFLNSCKLKSNILRELNYNLSKIKKWKSSLSDIESLVARNDLSKIYVDFDFSKILGSFLMQAYNLGYLSNLTDVEIADLNDLSEFNQNYENFVLNQFLRFKAENNITGLNDLIFSLKIKFNNFETKLENVVKKFKAK